MPRTLATRLLLFVFLFLPACQQEMARQPSYRPDEPSSFFPDGRAERPIVPGTAPRGQLRTDAHLYSGSRFPDGFGPGSAVVIVGAGGMNLSAFAALAASQSIDEGSAVNTFPFPVTDHVLKYGQNRYQIYCAVCHDPLGTGHGIIVERGYTPPPSLHIDRLRQAPVGHFFQVITKGYGSMPSYKKQVPPRDRWAIVAYVRALQLSQHFRVSDLPDDLRRQFAKQPPAQLAPANGVPEPAGGQP